MILLIYDQCGVEPLTFYSIPVTEAEWVNKCNNKYFNGDDITPEMEKLNNYITTLTPTPQADIYMPIYTNIVVFGFIP